MIDLIIPTLNRVGSLERLVKNIHIKTGTDHRIYFVVEPGDWGSYNEACRLGEAVIVSDEHPGTHTGAANTAYSVTKSEFFMMANDDLNFHLDWDILALHKMVDGVDVVGLNDGMGNMTTFTLVRREYVKNHSGCIDVPGVVYFPGYHHNYVDTEFAATAKKRGVWAEAPEAIVEHMHWSFHKSDKDATYIQSENTSLADSMLYDSRKHLFE